MKKLLNLTVLMLLCSLQFTSCNSDEADNPVSPTPIDPELAEPLTLEAIDDGEFYVIYLGNLRLEHPINYTINGVPGIPLTDETDVNTIEVKAGDKVCFFSQNKGVGQDSFDAEGTGYLNILSITPCYVYGNVMSLIDDEGDFANDVTIDCPYALYGLFEDDVMFLNHPTKKLLLPATKLSPYCYNRMFSVCMSLTAAPDLPAPILVEGCYNHMFDFCMSLNTIKCMATDLGDINNCALWLDGVAPIGTFVTPATTPWPINSSSGIPEGWTRIDTE